MIMKLNCFTPQATLARWTGAIEKASQHWQVFLLQHAQVDVKATRLHTVKTLVVAVQVVTIWATRVLLTRILVSGTWGARLHTD